MSKHALAVLSARRRGRGHGAAVGDVVVLDNLAAYKLAGLAEMVEACGARRLCLPPYPSDVNPIELAFSKLETWLRTAQARTRS